MRAAMRLRSVEVAWRKGWMRAIAASLPGPGVTRPPDWDARPWRVLYVRYEAVGDLIMATGVIRAIATSHATISVDVLASERNHQVVDHNPHVARVLRFDPRRGGASLARVALEVRAGRYDVIVDGRVNQPLAFTTTPLLMAASRAPIRVGAANPALARHVYNLAVPHFPRSVPYVERTSYLVEPFGVDRQATDFRPALYFAPAEREAAEAQWRAAPGAEGGTRFLVNISTSDVRRSWPDERCVEAVRHARGQRPDLSVLVIAMPGEWARACAVAEAVGGAAAPTLGVRAALAMVDSAALVFTPDTAISHAAAACDKPAVVMIARPGLDYAPYSRHAYLAVYDSWEVRDLAVPTVIKQLDALLARDAGRRPMVATPRGARGLGR